MIESEQGYEDANGDAWIRVGPGLYALAHSESHAQRLLDSGQVGVTLATVHKLYGPLKPIAAY